MRVRNLKRKVVTRVLELWQCSLCKKLKIKKRLCSERKQLKLKSKLRLIKSKSSFKMRSRRRNKLFKSGNLKMLILKRFLWKFQLLLHNSRLKNQQIKLLQNGVKLLNKCQEKGVPLHLRLKLILNQIRNLKKLWTRNWQPR